MYVCICTGLVDFGESWFRWHQNIHSFYTERQQHHHLPTCNRGDVLCKWEHTTILATDNHTPEMWNDANVPFEGVKTRDKIHVWKNASWCQTQVLKIMKKHTHTHTNQQQHIRVVEKSEQLVIKWQAQNECDKDEKCTIFCIWILRLGF